MDMGTSYRRNQANPLMDYQVWLKYVNPRTRGRARHGVTFSAAIFIQFQSTRPGAGATQRDILREIDRTQVSIHEPAAPARLGRILHRVQRVSIHAFPSPPRGRADVSIDPP